MLRASVRALSASRNLAAGRFAAPADKRTMCSAPQSVTVTFIDQDGDEIVCTGTEGTDLLQLAWDNDIEVEGACEKTLSCSTCHMYIPDELMMEVLSLCSSTAAEYWQRCSIVFDRTLLACLTLALQLALTRCLSFPHARHGLQLPEPEEDELDMLDLADNLQDK